MVKISEELFVDTLEAIKKGLDERAEFDKAMTKFSDAFFISNIGNTWLEALTRLLEDTVGDESSPKYGSTISWWLYENITPKVIYLQPHHPKNTTGEELEIPVETPQQLYRYFKDFN